MKRIILIITLAIPFYCCADIETDRAIAKIIHDSYTYMSADARASTEKAAYDIAAQKMLDALKIYLKEQHINQEISEIPEICQQITSKISDSRYRVLLYIKKSDITTNKLKRDPGVIIEIENLSSGEYSIKESQENDYPSQENIALENPTLSKIIRLQKREEVVETIKSLHKSRKLTGGATFPVGNANDFYIVVIDGDNVVTTLHYKDGQYIDLEDSKNTDINEYSHCTGYWFTLSNTK